MSRTTTWLTLMCIALWTTHCVAEQHPLRIDVQSSHSTILVYEGLPIEILITNESETPVSFYDRAFREEKIGAILVADPAGSLRRLQRPHHRGIVHHGPRGYKTLLPGESTSMSFLLFGDLARPDVGSVFQRTGEYKVFVEYDSRSATSDDPEFKHKVYARSDVLIVEVLEAPPREEHALKLVKALQEPFALYEPDLNFGPSDIEGLQQIASIEESQVYANYARYALAWRHVQLAAEALVMPKHFDYEEEASKAKKLLDAIRDDGFTLEDYVKKLREQFDVIQRTRAKIRDSTVKDS